MSVWVVNRTQVRIPGTRVRRIAAGILRELARRGGEKSRGYDLAIVLVGDRESKALHQRFFREAKPANVLSFDYGSFGEIILAPGVIRREARAGRESFDARLFRLMIHGAAHLAGIHHEGSRVLGRKAERWEATLAKRLGCAASAGESPPGRRGYGRKTHAHHIRRH